MFYLNNFFDVDKITISLKKDLKYLCFIISIN